MKGGIKLNKWHCFVIFVMLFFFPHLVHAAVTINDFFTPASKDLSVTYLKNVFGMIDSVLPSTGPRILGHMFSTFNAAILTLGGLVATYTVYMATINSAHDGEVMGKKWSGTSMWIAFRTAVGIGLIIPSKTTGYCVVQMIIMWIVLNSIGAADTVWNTVLSYVEGGGSLVAAQGQTSEPTRPPLTGMVTNFGYVFQKLVCMQLAANTPVVLPTFPTGVPVPPVDVTSFFREAPVPTIMTAGSGTNVQWSVNFTATTPAGEPVDCGSVSWTGDPSKYGGVKEEIATYLLPVINNIAFQYVVINEQVYRDPSIPPSLRNTSILTRTLQTVENMAGGNIFQKVKQYYSDKMYDEANKLMSDQEVSGSIYRKMSEQGWITAGSYYFRLAKNANSASPTTHTTMDLGINIDADAGHHINFPSPAFDNLNQPYAEDIMYAAKAFFVNQLRSVDITDIGAGASGSAAHHSHTTNMDIGNWGKVPFVKDILEALMGALSVGPNGSTNPVVAIHNFGEGILIAIQITWVFLLLAATLLALPMGTMTSVQPGGVIYHGIMDLAVPFIMFLLAALLGIGGLLGVYVPMVPFIIFTTAALGWLLSVVEAMVAAPLIGLGFMHPEGHEMLGHSEPAIMLLASIFLRPTLMLFGMIAAMLVSFAALQLLNATFWSYGRFLINGGPVPLFFVLAIYVGLVITLLNNCFAFIHQVPDKAMRWLKDGAGATFGEYGKDDGKAQEMMKGAEGFTKSAEAGISGKVGGGLRSRAQKGKEKSDQKKQKDESQRKDGGLEGDNPAGGDDGGGAGGGAGGGGGGDMPELPGTGGDSPPSGGGMPGGGGGGGGPTPTGGEGGAAGGGGAAAGGGGAAAAAG